jgi:hypothetical protein
MNHSREEGENPEEEFVEIFNDNDSGNVVS